MTHFRIIEIKVKDKKEISIANHADLLTFSSQVLKILLRTAHFMAQHTMLDALLLSWPFMLIFDTYWCTLKVHFPQFL